MDNINFHCPEFYLGQNFYQQLIELEDKHPEYFYENSKIDCIFGSFPYMIWNGGGVSQFGDLVSLENLKNIRDLYATLNISLKFTMTNPLIKETDCYDRYCNKVLEVFENGLNQILVSSPILEKYLKEKFPGYKYCKSIIATENDFDYEKELENYYQIVLPRRKVKDFDFLNSISKENRDKFELLCNDPCPITCPRLYTHYKDFAKATLYEIEKNDQSIFCTGLDCTGLRFSQVKEDQIFYDEIIKNYLPIGYNNFKLAGRGSLYNIIHAIIPYFIKPEYQFEAVFYFLF